MKARVKRVATHRWTARYEVVLPEIPEHGVRCWVGMVDAASEEEALAKAINRRPVAEHFKQLFTEA